METGRTVAGLLVLVVGLVGARYAHVVAAHQERWDVIGSKRNREEIEPTQWKITLVFFEMLFVVVLGLYLLVTGVF